ncbi:MAG: hypothetical protein COV36_02880 [Alphaproteobacteria bacterium CG11_big_fil_rev_8_21_14_0_20_44_7]|nr:MAG: hypothetical protein COV36_02880 [Alphaproteobacteria bacterium CG11_big_fil_rev_8_21_14_0_20_44_7]
MSKNQNILSGHKKVGKKFIPPMKQLPGIIRETNYLLEILPEILWMGLINEKHGYKKGIELVTTLAEVIKEVNNGEFKENFTATSSHKILSSKEKKLIKLKLEERKALSFIQEALNPLLTMYKNCPLSYLKSKNSRKNKASVEIIKRTIVNHMDKYETPALIIQANVVYILGIAGKLHIASHLPTPDLNSLINAPESESARRTASLVRSFSLQIFGMISDKYPTNSWARDFWNQSYSLANCTFYEEDLSE